MFSYKRYSKSQRYAKMLNNKRFNNNVKKFKSKQEYKFIPDSKSYSLSGKFTRITDNMGVRQGSVIVSSRVLDEELIDEVSKKLEELSNYTYSIFTVQNLTYTEAISIVNGKYSKIIDKTINNCENIERISKDVMKYKHLIGISQYINSNSTSVTNIISNLKKFNKTIVNVVDKYGRNQPFEINYVYYNMFTR